MMMTLREFGQRIRFFRILRKLSQQALAAVMHVKRQTVCRWERGQVAVAAVRVPDLCRVFAISPTDLFCTPLSCFEKADEIVVAAALMPRVSVIAKMRA